MRYAALAVVHVNPQPAKVTSGRCCPDKSVISAGSDDRNVGTRETSLQRGRRRGERLMRDLVGELRNARELAGVSQRTVAGEMGWFQSEVNRLETFRFEAVSLMR